MFSRKYILFEETNDDINENNRTEQTKGNETEAYVMREQFVQEDVLRNDKQGKN
jgi:hypothetical protein